MSRTSPRLAPRTGRLAWLAAMLLSACGGGAEPPPPTCTPTGPETCNGLDDDCDGQVDDGDPGGGAACPTGLLGVCAAGTEHCVGGTVQCVQNVQASAEKCNGLDDDCDGLSDQTDPDTQPPPVPEIPDGLDNDCNGLKDYNAIADPGFEAGFPWPAWEQYSTNFGTPICEAGCGTGGSPDPTHGGSGWLWLGGAPGPEIGWVRQSVVIPSGAYQLRFWIQIPSCAAGASDVFQVGVDGTVLFTASNADPACGTGDWIEQVLDIGAFTDGQPHAIELRGETNDPFGPAPLTNFFVDDLVLWVPQ